MKSKQLIERNLSFANTYEYLGITRGSIESGQLCSCDNCGKLITNMVTLGCRETGKKHTVGVDCTETLIKANSVMNGYNQDFHMDIYSFNKASRFVTEVNAGVPCENDGFYCTLTNRKGKLIMEFTSDIQKFYPEIL